MSRKKAAGHVWSQAPGDVPCIGYEPTCERCGAPCETTTQTCQEYHEQQQAGIIKRMARTALQMLTPEEIHDLCHDLPKTVPLEDFCKGCEEYQIKLYGSSPITALRAENERLAAQLREVAAQLKGSP